MFITFTTGKATPEQSARVNAFLAKFLPRMESEAGALAAYHFARPDRGDDVTVVIWPSEDVAMKYRQSKLVKEVRAFEEAEDMSVSREGYELSYPAATG